MRGGTEICFCGWGTSQWRIAVQHVFKVRKGNMRKPCSAKTDATSANRVSARIEAVPAPATSLSAWSTATSSAPLQLFPPLRYPQPKRQSTARGRIEDMQATRYSSGRQSTALARPREHAGLVDMRFFGSPSRAIVTFPRHASEGSGVKIFEAISALLERRRMYKQRRGDMPVSDQIKPHQT